MRARVVITGMGIVNALGPDLDTVWPRLLAAENGVDKISFFDASRYATTVAAEARFLPPLFVGTGDSTSTGLSSVPADFCRRAAHFFLRASREAFADSGLEASGFEPAQVGVAAGVSVNYLQLELLHYYYRFRSADGARLDMGRFAREGVQPENSFYLRLGELAAVLPAKALNLAGPNFAIDTACASSAFAVGEAYRLIQRGRAKAMIAGGAAALVNPIGILAFSRLGALSRNPDPEEASRPFDRRRDGFVMGEGGGAVLLEDLEHARARGAHVYAELAGYGVTVNAHNLTDPSPEGRCEEMAMRLALEEASLPPEEIDYVAAHGTSTAKNDLVETAALKRLFGSHAQRVLVSSHKAQIGHTISGAGISNLIFATKAIQDSCAPPTGHYRNADPDCDLDYVPNACRRAEIGAALANAFAFGGQNAVLVATAL